MKRNWKLDYSIHLALAGVCVPLAWAGWLEFYFFMLVRSWYMVCGAAACLFSAWLFGRMVDHARRIRRRERAQKVMDAVAAGLTRHVDRVLMFGNGRNGSIISGVPTYERKYAVGAKTARQRRGK